LTTPAPDRHDAEQPLERAIGPWALGANTVNLTIGAGILALPAAVAVILGPAAVVAQIGAATLVLFFAFGGTETALAPAWCAAGHLTYPSAQWPGVSRMHDD
jgi:amino acid transporter